MAAVLAGAAVAATCLVPVLRTTPWLTSVLAVALAGWVGGVAAMSVATGVASLGIFLLVLAPAGTGGVHSAVVQTVAFLLIALAMTYLVRQREVAMAALRASESHYRSISETAADVIIAIDRDSRILSVNATVRRVFGYEPEELLGEEMTVLMPEQLRDAHRSGLMQYLATGQKHIPWSGIQLPGRRKDGTEIPLEISFGTYSAGTQTQFAGFIRDISERQNAQAALLRTEKLAAVGRLASSIAHEVNNPLEAITNLLYLTHGAGEITQLRQYIAAAEEQLRRVSMIANQTLRFHRETGAAAPVSCDRIILESLALFQGRVRNLSCTVSERFRAERSARCREGEILQVVNNLVANALDALLPGRGKLWVRSRDATDWKTGEVGVSITIADNGTGMSQETKARAFESFFTTKGMAGTGLGLWVCRELVERNGGRILVRSRQTDDRSGTVFSVYLPASTVLQGASKGHAPHMHVSTVRSSSEIDSPAAPPSLVPGDRAEKPA